MDSQCIMTDEPRECSVCIEKLNKTKHKLIKCGCNYSQCSSCVEKYLLSIHTIAHCMNCKKEWDRRFLSENMTKTFLFKTYKNYRESVLFDRERSMFPETMPYVEQRKKAKELYAEVSESEEKINEIKRQELRLRKILDENAEMDFSEKDEICKQIKNLKIERKTLECENDYKNNIAGILLNINTKTPVERAKFIRACPVNECRGFLSTQWKCGLCDTWTCPDCHEVIGLDRDLPHTCLESNIRTAQLLDNDSKPCPKCASLIFRISGCPQMFCTSCHTGFDWNTGRLIQGERFHNPHYFNYMRERASQQNTIPSDLAPVDLDCTVIPPIETVTGREKRILTVVEKKFQEIISDDLSPEEIVIIEQQNREIRQFNSEAKIKNKEAFNNFKEIFGITITDVYQNHQHIEHQIIPQLLPNENIATTNRETRILYLIGKITEVEFRTLLQRQEKIENKKHDNLLVCQMFCQASLDIIHRFMREVETVEQYTDLIREFMELKNYMTMMLENVGKTYNCVPLRFDERRAMHQYRY